jgi:hypothetical protein
VLDSFSIPLTDDMKQNVDEALGASTLDSFDVWIGKDDSMLHQYAFTLSAPLSKVIALDDKGIAGKEVTLSFEDTFSDFNVPNTIVMPTSSTSISDFVKIKNAVSAFAPLAKSLANAEGGYGRKSNTGGSCENPASGSLFSPLGQKQSAGTQVSLIASAINSLLGQTNNMGSCYSTPSAWAVSVPLASEAQSNGLVLYCADSTGALLETTTELAGTVCK